MALPVSQGGIDYPDGGFSSGSGVFPALGDLAELAVRLNSVNVYDRRGNVSWQDSFESGLTPYRIIEDGTGAEVITSAAYSLHGSYSCKLTAGSDDILHASVDHYEPYLPPGKIGAQFAFSVATNIDRLELWCRIYTGTELYDMAARFDDNNDKLLVLVEPSTWTEVADLWYPPPRANTFNRLKVVADVSTGYYVRILLNGIEYDISDHLVDVAASGGQPSTMIWIRLYSRSGQNDVAYVDGIILTQNEP